MEEVQPLSSLKELMEWSMPCLTSNIHRERLRARPPSSHLRTLVCHDMKGGYLDDSFDFLLLLVLLLPPSFVMEEDTHDHQAELPSSAQEDVLLLHGDSPGAPGSFGSQASTRSMRFCSRIACTQILGSFLHNPDSVCVKCRDICCLSKKWVNVLTGVVRKWLLHISNSAV
ncbi:hypothetical protein E2C01_089697 [Portunus trituberculatus]|uniref:Uncharacterized protein n=1 Tax=Portunus trituberculatus TaxID=210409 RepID=A0A5B7JQA5_PORTR|nr:hypothetical protein [Portunus trituberculatus]